MDGLRKYCFAAGERSQAEKVEAMEVAEGERRDEVN